MRLNLTQIKTITKGAVRVTEEDGYFCFYRFTKEQEELYERTKEEFYRQTFATAGIRLNFKTDSKTLLMKVQEENSSGRKYFSFDVFVNGELIDCLDNFGNVEIPQKYIEVELPLGEFSKTFDLGEGEKTVDIYFPYCSRSRIEEFVLDDGSYIEPIPSEKILLAYGDSITQGHDALRPSNRYVAKLADYLGAEEFNKGMGSDGFFPALAELKDDFVPDYIVVSHGTNNWRRNHTRERFQELSTGFFQALRKNYPDARIIAITPIWRKDHQDERPYGNFWDMEQDIRDAVKDLGNVVVVPGTELIPHEEGYYADLFLHPNDRGFEQYIKNLIARI